MPEDKNREKYTTKYIKIKDIYNGKQIRFSSQSEKTQEQMSSMKEEGQLQPIGVCNSKELKENPQFKYHLMWGQRRIFSAMELGWTEIEAKIWDMEEELDEVDRKAKAAAENFIRVQMEPKEVRKTILDIYKGTNKNENKTKKLLPIDNKIIDLAIKEFKIDKIDGGEEVKKYVYDDTNIEKPGNYIMDIVKVCQTEDKSKVNVKKAKQLADVLKKYDHAVMKKILAAADATRTDSVETWEKDGLFMDNEVNKQVTFLESELQRIEAFLEREEKSLNIFVHDLVMDNIGSLEIEESPE